MIHRLPIFILTALTTFAFASASASAVTVENPGMFAVTGENTIAIRLAPESGIPPRVDVVRCDNQWEAQVEADGHVDIHNLDFALHAGSTTNCATANDCGPDAGWEGQIVEGGVNEFNVNLTACLIGIGPPLSGVPFNVSCSYEHATASVHCDYLFAELTHPQLGHSWVEVEGEVFLNSQLNLMH